MEALTISQPYLVLIVHMQVQTFWEPDSIPPRYPTKLKITNFRRHFGLKSVR